MDAHQTKSIEKEAHKDLKKAQALDAMTKTEGGRVLLEASARDVDNSIQAIRTGYKTMTHAELLAECATLASMLSIFELVTNTKKNVDFLIQQIKELTPDFDSDTD